MLVLVCKRSLSPAEAKWPVIVNTFLSKTPGKNNPSACKIDKRIHLTKIKQKVFGTGDVKHGFIMCILNQPLSLMKAVRSIQRDVSFWQLQRSFLGSCLYQLFLLLFLSIICFWSQFFLFGVILLWGEVNFITWNGSASSKERLNSDIEVCSVFHNKSSIESPVDVDHRGASELHLS